MVSMSETPWHHARVTAKRGLGELEASVMDLMWSADEPRTVREVLDILPTQRRLAYTTVMTVMNNLYRKGLLVRSLDGRAYRYRPARPRAEHTAELMRELLAESGDRSTTLLRFVDHMPADELTDLRRALGRRRSTSA